MLETEDFEHIGVQIPEEENAVADFWQWQHSVVVILYGPFGDDVASSKRSGVDRSYQSALHNVLPPSGFSHHSHVLNDLKEV